ncbi:MAG: hypothetical protein WBO74_14270 [Thermoanaerobaculia bacterium]
MSTSPVFDTLARRFGVPGAFRTRLGLVAFVFFFPPLSVILNPRFWCSPDAVLPEGQGRFAI